MHYRLEGSTDLKLIGKSVQIETCVFPVHLDEDPRSTKGFWYEKADLIKLIFPEPILHNRAKLTDFIPCHVIGTRSMPLISEKLKYIIENSINNEPQFIPAKLHYKNECLTNYFFLNAYNFMPDMIDFTLSTVRYSSYKKPPDGQLLKIQSITEYYNIEKKLAPPIGLKINPLELNQLAEKFDFFSLKWVYGSGYIVSQKFFEIATQNHISGIRFMQLNERY